MWEQEEQWEPLWGDIERLAESILDREQPKAHFMGAIVLQQMEFPSGTMQRRLVVDGQQRLTTLQLLMDAIQEVMEVRGHSNPSGRLLDLVTNAEKYWNGKPDRAFKVWPTVVDRVPFRHAMSNELSATQHTASRIVRAHEYFKAQACQWLDKLPQDNGERDRNANALEEAVSLKLEIVVIDLGGSENPHVIFETLNARGTPLLQSDMVKNKILHEAGIGLEDDEDDPTPKKKSIWPFDQSEWWAEDIGRGLQRRPRIDVYLNHWLTLRNRAETKPYNEFSVFDRYAKAQTARGNSIQDVAQDLSALGNIYRDLEEFRRSDIERFLKRRNVMNVGVVTPLPLWLLSADLAPLNLANCLGALEGVEQELRTNKAESQNVPAGLQIEHVIPQTWRDNWPLQEDAGDKQDAIENRYRIIHTIGNLTLVNERLNPALSNAPWADKRQALAEHSVLYLNKSLVNEGPEHWDEAAIEERSKWLHECSIKIWPHADDFRVQ